MPFARVPDAEHPGRGDGEALRAGWVAQPICAASSTALLVGAAVLARDARRAAAMGVRDRADVLAARALVVSLAGNGLGSIGFHGPGDRVSRAVHDVSLWAVVTASAVGAARTVMRSPGGGIRDLALPAALLAGGALVGRLCRTGGRWCRPRSPLQGHAAWHVLAAAAVTLSGRRMVGGRAPRTGPGRRGTT